MLKNFNITLINPNTIGDYRIANLPTANVGIAALYSYLIEKTECSVNIIDARFKNLSPQAAVKKEKKRFSNVVGLSLCSHESADWVSQFAELLKKERPDVQIVLGGCFPSLFPNKAFELIPCADFLVIGEGELTFLALLRHLKNNTDWHDEQGIAYQSAMTKKVIINGRRALIEDLDSMPWPERYLACGDGSHLEVEIEGARGCFYQCTFCSVVPFYGVSAKPRLRTRSAKHIFNEMGSLKKKFPKLRDFRFADPDFICGICAKRSEELAKLIIKNQLDVRLQIDTRASSIKRNRLLLEFLQKAGLVFIYIGIENGSQEILNRMDKYTRVEDNIAACDILRQLGIDYNYGFMMFTPWTTEEDIDKNLHLLERIGNIGLHNIFDEMTIVPGTKVFEEMEKEGRLLWKGRRHYFTYKAQSERVEHLRHLRKVLGERHQRFIANLYFIYKSIRRIRMNQDFTRSNTVEANLNDILLSFFKDCWDYTAANHADVIKDNQLIDKLYSKYNERVVDTLRLIDADIPIPCPVDWAVSSMSVHQV